MVAETPLPPVIDIETWTQLVAGTRMSPKQAAWVALMMHGLHDKEIGAQLGLAYQTLRTHRDRAIRRLKLKEANRAAVTTRVFELAWRARDRSPCPKCGYQRNH